MMTQVNNANFAVHFLDQKFMVSPIELIDESYRPEAMPKHSSSWCGLETSSLVMRFKFKNNIVRIKQFLYDLGPSSTLGLGAFFDFYPWKVKVVALGENKPAWFGCDNKGRQALGFLSHLTSIQISAEEGELEQRDFIDLANAMAPIPSHISARTAPFADLSYWSRFPQAYSYLTISPDYAIPTSLWRARWPISSKDAKVIWRAPSRDTIIGHWRRNSSYTKILHRERPSKGANYWCLCKRRHIK